MSNSAALAALELDAQNARARFRGTAATMRARFRASRLAGDAVADARVGVAKLAHATSNKARANPAVAITVAGAAVLLLARRPVLRMIDSARR